MVLVMARMRSPTSRIAWRMARPLANTAPGTASVTASPSFASNSGGLESSMSTCRMNASRLPKLRATSSKSMKTQLTAFSVYMLRMPKYCTATSRPAAPTTPTIS